MKNMSYISKQDTDDLMLTEAISFISKSGIKQKSLIDEVIKESKEAKLTLTDKDVKQLLSSLSESEFSKKEILTDKDIKQLLNSISESEVSPEMYAELHPESVIIKKHNKELAKECKFKPKSKNCEYKNYWEKCAYCSKEFSR